MNIFKFMYSSNPDSEGKMYDDVSDLLIEWDIPHKLRNHILLAVSEAFTNALIHGNKADPAKKIQLFISIKNNEITADIVDEGCGLPNDFENRKDVSLWNEGGRGLKIMESITGKIKFGKNAETGGLQVTMTFDRSDYEIEKDNIRT